MQPAEATEPQYHRTTKYASASCGTDTMSRSGRARRRMDVLYWGGPPRGPRADIVGRGAFVPGKVRREGSCGIPAAETVWGCEPKVRVGSEDSTIHVVGAILTKSKHCCYVGDRGASHFGLC